MLHVIQHNVQHRMAPRSSRLFPIPVAAKKILTSPLLRSRVLIRATRRLTYALRIRLLLVRRARSPTSEHPLTQARRFPFLPSARGLPSPFLIRRMHIPCLIRGKPRRDSLHRRPTGSTRSLHRLKPHNPHPLSPFGPRKDATLPGLLFIIIKFIPIYEM